MRCVYLWDGGEEGPWLGFKRDQALLAALRCGVGADAACAKAYARLWHWPLEGLAFGRFHRMPEAGRAMGRRLSGGKIVALGPGILGLTLVLPGAGWLEPGKPEPAPEQILNRALRPLLALLRQLGVAAFYPGRDLVTVDGRGLAHAAFTAMPDGALLIEQHLGVSGCLSATSSLLAQLDPAGVAASDPSAFADSTSLGELLAVPQREDWLTLFGEHLGASFGCSVSTASQAPSELADMSELDEQAFVALCAERRALPEGWVSALALQSLGVVEVAARISSGRIGELVISGDLIAPAVTLELIAERCVGQPPVAATARRALISVLSRPGNFLFGVEDLDDLVGRMV